MPRCPRMGVISVTTIVRHGWRSACFVSPHPSVSSSFVLLADAYHISSPFCFFHTSFPALCGPSSLMYRTVIYAVWLTSYPKLSLVPEQIILHSPISTALNDGASGASKFPEITVLLATPAYVALYLLSVLQAFTSTSPVQSALYSIRWANDIAGLESPTSPFFSSDFKSLFV